MLIFYERIDGEGKLTAGALDVVDLESFADQMIEFFDEGARSVAILKIDKDGGVA